MIQEVLESIQGAGKYAAVALVLFMGAFVVILYRVIRMKKRDIEILRRLPFDSDPPPERETKDD